MVTSVNRSEFDDLGLSLPKTAQKQQLGQEEFLNLMMTQLKNQDPFKPMESGEFLGQLAQFGTVQGLAGLQNSFNSLASSLVSNQALQAASLVGRSALVASNKAMLAGGGVVEGAVDVPATTGNVKIEIRDSAGQVVRNLELGSQNAGLVRFEWDGVTNDGEPAPAGTYTVAATYQRDKGSEAADTFVAAPIDSVLFSSNGFAVQLRGLGEVPFSTVREIRNPTASIPETVSN